MAAQALAATPAGGEPTLADLQVSTRLLNCFRRRWSGPHRGELRLWALEEWMGRECPTLYSLMLRYATPDVVPAGEFAAVPDREYLRLRDFGEGSLRELREALARCQRQEDHD